MNAASDCLLFLTLQSNFEIALTASFEGSDEKVTDLF